MTVFSKIDKKVIAVSVIILAVVLIGVVLIYGFVAGKPGDIKNLTGGAKVEQNNNANEAAPQVEVGTGGVTIEGDNNTGLLICSDKCGDGICQNENVVCDNLNCACFEDTELCPQDCE